MVRSAATLALCPERFRGVDVVSVALTAAIGFTVALFLATAAFPEGAE
jgi:hypothetical protein